MFGALLLPLYFQIARGLSPLQAGLLMAPQGLAAALGMNRAGRLTDRIGGGPVVVAGVIMLMLGTVCLHPGPRHDLLLLLEASLMARGIGLGFAMMPAMAAAYATLERSQVPRATPMLNVLQRVGGSLGTALVAVVLQHQLVANVGGGLTTARSGAARAAPLASAFAHTYWWVMGSTAVACYRPSRWPLAAGGGATRPPRASPRLVSGAASAARGPAVARAASRARRWCRPPG